MPAPLNIDWQQARLDFIRLRSEGMRYELVLAEIAERYACAPSTVEYHARKDAWAQSLDAARGHVQTALMEKLDITVEAIAKEIGQQMLSILDEFKTNPAKKVSDLATKAQALKILSEVRSRYNPDGQESTGGQALFQVNIASMPAEKPVIEAKAEQSQ